MISGEIKYVLSDSLAYCVTFTLHSVKWWSRSKVDREVDASDFFLKKQYELQQSNRMYKIHISCATIWVFALTHTKHTYRHARWLKLTGSGGDPSVHSSGVFENANQQTNHDSDLPVLLFYPTTCRGFIYTYWCMCTTTTPTVFIRMHVSHTQQLRLVFRVWISEERSIRIEHDISIQWV